MLSLQKLISLGTTHRRNKEQDWADFMPRINSISISSKSFTGIADISILSSLTALYLNDNKLKTVDGLAGCRALKRLFLQNNELTSLRGIDGLINLEILNVSGNRICVCSFSKLPRMSSLKIDNQETALVFDIESCKTANVSYQFLTPDVDQHIYNFKRTYRCFFYILPSKHPRAGSFI